MGIALALALLTAQSFPAQLTGFDRRWEEIKRQATPQELYAILWELPKGGDLHNHHEYSVSMAEWFRVAATGNYYARWRQAGCGEEPSFYTVRAATYEALPACARGDYKRLSQFTVAERAAWISALELDQPGEGREEFFARLVRRHGELERDPELMALMLVEQLRQAKAENLLYVETQLDPRGFRNADGTRLGEDKGAEYIRRRLRDPAVVALGVTTRFQVSELRFAPDAEAELRNAFDFVHRNSDLWKGVNLVGREDDPRGQASRFTEVFRDLRRRYFEVRLALHGGEQDQPGRQVRETLELGAERIGHGVNLISDPETLLLLRGGRYLVEINLVSNLLLGYATDLDRHPFPEYLRLGVPVCLNTDDRGAMRSNLTDEYFLAVKHFNLSWQEVVRLGRQSLEFSFVEEPVKARLLAEYARRVRLFGERYGGAWRAHAARVTPAVSGLARDRLLPSSR